jgi:hypothetical protein
LTDNLLSKVRLSVGGKFSRSWLSHDVQAEDNLACECVQEQSPFLAAVARNTSFVEGATGRLDMDFVPESISERCDSGWRDNIGVVEGQRRKLTIRPLRSARGRMTDEIRTII